MNKIGFRYDINALRAFAVIGVILFHYKIPYFQGGFSGVDVFFVISGYLMSKIILTDIKANQFSLINFYNKRVQRIIPALFFFVFLICTIGFFIYLPVDYHVVVKNATASLLFFSNILYCFKNYFDTSSDSNIFLHTWSLSVEWQFYLLLPLILLGLNRFLDSSKRLYIVFFSTVTGIIFIVSHYYSLIYPNYSFYLLPSRSWEMMLGGVVFLVEPYTRLSYRKQISYFSYAAIALCFIFLNSNMTWPGVFTIIPTSITALIISLNSNDLPFIRSKIIQFIGKISYSLYLWHWPVYVIGNYLLVKTTLLTSGLYSAIAIVLAYISYTYVESIKFKSSLTIVKWVAALASITTFLFFTNSNKIAFNQETVFISSYHNNHLDEFKNQFRLGTCFNHGGLQDFHEEECLSLVKGRKNFLLLGDSHAAHFAQSLSESFEKANLHLNQATVTGCLPIIRKNGEQPCTEVIDYIYFNYLPKHASEITGVILGARWKADQYTADIVQDLNETINYLHRLKIKVVILGQSEVYRSPYSTIAAREYYFNTSLSDDLISTDESEVNNLLKKNFLPYYIDIYNKAQVAKLSAEHIPYMFDENHFTLSGANAITNLIVTNTLFTDFVK